MYEPVETAMFIKYYKTNWNEAFNSALLNKLVERYMTYKLMKITGKQWG